MYGEMEYGSELAKEMIEFVADKITAKKKDLEFSGELLDYFYFEKRFIEFIYGDDIEQAERAKRLIPQSMKHYHYELELLEQRSKEQFEVLVAFVINPFSSYNEIAEILKKNKTTVFRLLTSAAKHSELARKIIYLKKYFNCKT